MRNATIEDVKKARETGKLEENVMYKHGANLVHGKAFHDAFRYCCEVYTGMVVAESNEGKLTGVYLKLLEPIRKGLAQQPKKPRRKPVKGTRPERLIPMSAYVNLKVGDKVVYKDGTRDAVSEVDDGSEWCYETVRKGWYNKTGEHNIGYTEDDIVYKILPWEEQSRFYFNVQLVKQVENWQISLQEKSPEQEAFEKGYWVPFIAGAQTCCPSFAVGYKVDYQMGELQSHRPQYAENLRWTRWNLGSDIVAFRKAKQ